MQTISILGGNGFLGSAVAEQAIKHFPESTIICIARNIPEKKIPKIEYKKGDLLKKEEILPLLQYSEGIINCTGFVSFRQNDTKKLEEANVQTIKNLVEIANTLPHLKKLIHISSCSAFGAQTGSFSVHTSEKFSEKEKKLLPYSFSKYRAEQAFQNANFSYSLVCPPLITDEEFWKKIKQKIKKFPIFCAPPGSNGIIDKNNLATKVIQLMKSECFPEKIIFSGKTLEFKNIPKFLGIEKKVIVLPHWSKNFLLPLASFLERFNFPLSRENIFFGFCKRDPKEEEITKKFS